MKKLIAVLALLASVSANANSFPINNNTAMQCAAYVSEMSTAAMVMAQDRGDDVQAALKPYLDRQQALINQSVSMLQDEYTSKGWGTSIDVPYIAADYASAVVLAKSLVTPQTETVIENANRKMGVMMNWYERLNCSKIEGMAKTAPPYVVK